MNQHFVKAPSRNSRASGPRRERPPFMDNTLRQDWKKFHCLHFCTLWSDRQALTGTRYPTLPGFNFYYPYPTRKSFEKFRVQGSNYTCCFHTGLYQWCQLFSSGGKGFSFIIPLYTGFRNMQVTICQKHSSWTNITTSCNYDCNFEVFTLFCRTASEIFHSIIWEFLSQFTNFLVITLLEKF